MLRSALVALDGSPYSEAATTLALDWATRFGARLVGLGVVDEASICGPEAVPLGGSAYKKARDAARTAEAHRQVTEWLTRFRQRSLAAGVEADVLEGVGEPADRILREAQRCDVVVLGRETHFRFEAHDRPDSTLGMVLRHSPRPVVIVPRQLAEGRGVLLAYGGGREAARAMQVFQLLGLAAGEDIEVLTINRDGLEAERLAHLASDFLGAHGASHHVRPIVSDAAPAEVLLELVRYHSPRLVVMGAHGHHPVRDLFATSVTRAVLRACPVPVFVGA